MKLSHLVRSHPALFVATWWQTATLSCSVHLFPTVKSQNTNSTPAKLPAAATGSTALRKSGLRRGGDEMWPAPEVCAARSQLEVLPTCSPRPYMEVNRILTVGWSYCAICSGIIVLWKYGKPSQHILKLFISLWHPNDGGQQGAGSWESVNNVTHVGVSAGNILTAGTRSFLTSSTALLILISALFCVSSTVIRTWRSSFRCSQFGFPLFCSSWTETQRERDGEWMWQRGRAGAAAVPLRYKTEEKRDGPLREEAGWQDRPVSQLFNWNFERTPFFNRSHASQRQRWQRALQQLISERDEWMQGSERDGSGF